MLNQHPTTADTTALPTASTAYSQWYASPSNDPFHANYSPVLAPFNPDLGISAAALLKQVLGSTSIPQAFTVVCNTE